MKISKSNKIMDDWENLLDDNVDIKIQKEGETFEGEEIKIKKEQKPAQNGSTSQQPGEKKAKKAAKTEEKSDNIPAKELTEADKLRIEK